MRSEDVKVAVATEAVWLVQILAHGAELSGHAPGDQVGLPASRARALVAAGSAKLVRVLTTTTH